MTWNLPPLRRLIVAISSPPAALSDSMVANPGLLRTSNRAVPASSEIVKRSGHHLPDNTYCTDAVLCVGPGVVDDAGASPDLAIRSARSLCVPRSGSVHQVASLRTPCSPAARREMEAQMAAGELGQGDADASCWVSL